MFKRNKEKSALDEAIEARIEDLDVNDNLDQDEAKIENLKELVEVKEKLEGPKRSIDPNSILTIVGSMAGTLLILNYEKANALTTKAFGLVQRMFK